MSNPLQHECELLCICVNYKNDEETIEFVQDLERHNKDSRTRILIVDNTPAAERRSILSDGTAAIASCTIVVPGENLGFYPGAAWALKSYLKSGSLPTWVMVSNTDMRAPGDDLLDKLDTLGADEPPAVIAPSILSTLTGNDQNPQIESRPSRWRWRSYLWIFRYYPVFITYMFASVAKNTIVAQLKRIGLFQAVAEKPRPRRIYAPHGSCVIFHRSYFESGASIAHGILLFGETIGVAEQARKLGLKIVYDPSIQFYHREHSTTGRIKSKHIARLQYEAAEYCWHKYFKRNDTNAEV